MQFALITALALALLGFVWAEASNNDKHHICHFLQNAEEDRGILVEFLAEKALTVARNVIPKLGNGSSFEKFMTENSSLLSNTKQRVDFILRFRCAYKNLILGNGLYKDNPDFRQIFTTYKSESNKEIAEFDKLLGQDAKRMLRKMEKASESTKQEFNEALQTYLHRKGISAHCMMNRFLMLKSKYECDYQLDLDLNAIIN